MAEFSDDELVYEDHSQLPDIMPIFPLPNVVLFPNSSLPLFIFEDRYKQMVRDCLEGDPGEPRHGHEARGGRARALLHRRRAVRALLRPVHSPVSV
jgi:hypothetical protein